MRRTVAERGRRAGFVSVEEFASAAGLAPHEFARLRDRLTCTRPATHWQRPPEGRVPGGGVENRGRARPET
ncbi:hypothetical protein [Dactylosporangium sp. NPDC050588]|uniref:hypothetical protein n=1 Tax=Dactylosporangium sp. NPDC050588 TaxID=3157211 RepID=UPI0033FB459F